MTVQTADLHVTFARRRDAGRCTFRGCPFRWRDGHTGPCHEHRSVVPHDLTPGTTNLTETTP